MFGKLKRKNENRDAAVIRILTTVRKKMTVPQISGLLSTVGCEELSDWTLHDMLGRLANEGKVVREVVKKEINGVVCHPTFWYAPGIELIEDGKEQK